VPAPRTFTSKTDAALFLATVETDMARGQFIDPREGRITLAKWSEEWLALPGKRAATVARDAQGLAVFLRNLAPLPLAAITPKHVQAAVSARAQEVAPATLRRDFAALRAVLNAAVDADRIARSPARKIALPALRTTERPTLTPEGLARLVDEVPGNYRALILTGAVLGLRWGEAIGLRVRDIDFPNRTITVAGAVKELAGHLSIEPEAKTHRSLRTLAVPEFLIYELARHLTEYRGSRPEADSDELVFLGPRGGVLRRRFVERVLRPAVERILAEDAKAKREPVVPAALTFHALRHVAVTAMADAGVPFNVTQGRAGHSTAHMTLERYAHRSTEADKAAARALQSHFSEAFSNGTGTERARNTVTAVGVDA